MYEWSTEKQVSHVRQRSACPVRSVWSSTVEQKQVQKLTDEHTKAIDDLLKHKEAEIMEV